MTPRTGGGLLRTLAAAALLAPAALPAAVEFESVIATGDAVERFGRIGRAPARVLGIDDAGRVLLAAGLSDGRTGLFFADGATLTTLWISGGGSDDLLDPWHASLSPSGRVIAATYQRPGTRAQTVYELDGGTLRRIAATGDLDVEDRTLCQFSAPRMNGSGIAAFQATAAHAGCDYYIRAHDVFVAANGVIRRVAGATYHSAPTLIGISEAGEVLVLVEESPFGTQIQARSNGEVRAIAGGGRGEEGLQLRGIFSAAASPNGNVAFVASDHDVAGVYRTAAGRVIRVVAADEPPPIGVAFAGFGIGDVAPPALNDAGDVAFAAVVRLDGAEPDRTARVVLRYRADGTRQVVFSEGTPPRFEPASLRLLAGDLVINPRGDVAFGVQASGGVASEVQVRWLGAGIEPVLATGDAGPDGSIFATAGISAPHCLASDGSVAFTAESVSGGRGLLCVDSAGAHLVFQSGDSDPAGRAFEDVAGYEAYFEPQCAFAPDRRLLFRAVVREPVDGYAAIGAPGLYRAGPQRIERLLAAGDVVGGTVVRRVEAPMAVNAASDVAVAVTADTGRTAIMRSRGAGFETIVGPLPVTTADGRELTEVVRLALADDGAVAMVGRVKGVAVDGRLYTEEGNAVLRWRDGDLRVVVDADDVADDKFPYGRLAHVLAAGDLIAFAADHATRAGRHMDLVTHRRRLFGLGAGDPRPRRVHPPLPVEPDGAFWRPVDLNAAGLLLIEEGLRSLLLDPALPDPIEVADLNRNIAPFGLGDGGTVAALSWDAVSPGTRTAIELSGPRAAAASCPEPPPLTPPGPSTPTPIPTAAPRCIGDCDGDGVVSVDELVAMVRCLLSPCLFAQRCDGEGEVNVVQLVRAVNNAMNGCGPL